MFIKTRRESDIGVKTPDSIINLIRLFNLCKWNYQAQPGDSISFLSILGKFPDIYNIFKIFGGLMFV